MRFTFAHISHKKEVYEQYLKPCLKLIENDVDIITKTNTVPSIFFNQVLNESKNRYIIFSHEDVTFSKDILDCIRMTIEKTPNFGVLCVVGKNEVNKNIGSLVSCQYNLKFCDPCFFVVDKENPTRFDEVIFDGFHFGVEDYCVSSEQLHNRLTYTIHINWGKDNDKPSSFKHHSYTCRTVKYQWGNYIEYKNRFKKKWNNLNNIKNF